MPAVRQITQPNIISIVVGNGYTHAQQGRKTAHFPSVTGVKQAAFSGSDLGTGEVKAPALKIGDSWYVWGEAAYTHSRLQSASMGSEKIGSLTYTRLLLAGMYEIFGAQDAYIDTLVTTLPVLYYEKDREKMRGLISGTYNLEDEKGNKFSYVIPASAVKVLPEGLPTIYDFLYSENLNVKNEGLLLTKRGDAAITGVGNLGTYTFDMILIKEQKPIVAQCHSVDIGLNKVWEEIIRHARTEHGRSLTPHEADNAMKTGYIYIGKNPTDIKPVIRMMLEQLAENVAQEINSRWNNALELQNLVFAGGGAPQVSEFLLERYSKNVELYYHESIEKSANTETAGAYKIAEIKERAKS